MKANWEPNKYLELTTNNFFLRSINENDISEEQLLWLKDKQVNRWLNSYHKKHTVKSMKKYIKKFDNSNSFHLGIFLKNKKKQIGYFSILIDHFHKVAEIRVLIGEKKWWGKGVVLECRKAIIDWLFYDLKLYKIFGSPLVKNIAAVFNYQKQGFKCESILREHRLMNYSDRCDVAIFSIFRKDWIKRYNK